MLPVTVAVNCCDLPAIRSTAVGERLIDAPETRTIPTFASSLVLACEMAVTVTVLGLGTVVGGVYSPSLVIVPTVEFPPLVPFTSQVKAVFDEPDTSAVNCNVLPRLTVVVVSGWRVMVTVDVVVVQFVVDVALLEQLLPPQPATASTHARNAREKNACFICLFPRPYRGSGTIKMRLLFW